MAQRFYWCIVTLALGALRCTAEPDHISLLADMAEKNDGGSREMDAMQPPSGERDAARTEDGGGELGSAIPACTSDAECGAPSPYCDLATGACVECLGDPNCLVGTCDPDSHRCIQSCTSASDCTEGYCNVDWGQCVECTSSADCYSSDKPLCNTGIGQCVQCLTNAECATGLCLASRGECAECRIDADCDVGQVCDPIRFECQG